MAVKMQLRCQRCSGLEYNARLGPADEYAAMWGCPGGTIHVWRSEPAPTQADVDAVARQLLATLPTDHHLDDGPPLPKIMAHSILAAIFAMRQIQEARAKRQRWRGVDTDCS